MAKSANEMIPNIVIWSWMRTVLDLSGSELLIFSYIFSQTFDNVHPCTTKLSEMETWFGVSRQTITRNVEKMVNKGFILKNCTNDPFNPIIKHNSYKVDVENITHLCEDSDFDSYTNFIESYKSILIQKFPDDETTIDEYFKRFLSWHKAKNEIVNVRFADICKAIVSNEINLSDNFGTFIQSLSEIDNGVPEFTVSNKSENVSNSLKQSTESADTVTMVSLIEKSKPKKTKAEIRNEAKAKKIMLNHDFVVNHGSNNQELLELLNEFLETKNGKSYTVVQWQFQLQDLLKYGRNLKRMIPAVRQACKCGYRSIIFEDKTESDIDEKLLEVDLYVSEFADGNEELAELLKDYVQDVAHGKKVTVKQFRLMLKNLTTLCPTTEDKIASVETSYACGYNALAYSNTSNSSSIVSDKCVDIDAKIEAIDEFITNGWYQLVDGLRDSLISYVKTTHHGMTMTVDSFKLNLDMLRLNCFLDDDKVNSVKRAVLNNYPRLCTENFDETRNLTKKHTSREAQAKSLDRSRMQDVQSYHRKHPDDPRLSMLPKPKPLINTATLI